MALRISLHRLRTTRVEGLVQNGGSLVCHLLKILLEKAMTLLQLEP